MHVSKNRLHHRFGASKVEASLKGIGYAVNLDSNQNIYRLLFFGLFFINDGKHAENLLVEYFEYLKALFNRNPDLDEISSDEVTKDLSLDFDRQMLLYNIVVLGSFSSSKSYDGWLSWHSSVPDDIDHFAEKDMISHVEEIIFKNYDPMMPVNSDEAGPYIMRKTLKQIPNYSIPVLSLQEAISRNNVEELNKHLMRLRGAINTDPELAIGSSKDLLETVCKVIMESSIGGTYDKNDDLPILLKRVQRELLIEPTSCGDKDADKVLKRTLSNLGQIVVGVGEVRNLVGTGHGKGMISSNISSAHSNFVVNAASTIATFLLELNNLKKN
ncbi:MAG: abortive infection family protein [Syntrophomonas sp.]